MPAASGSRLHLGKVQLRVRSAKAIDWPAQWGNEAGFGRATASSLQELLAPLLDPADPSVWIIRRLALSAIVDGDAPGPAARCFGLALRGALQRALHGEDGEGILRFADRAAYLARLLADVARGDGFERWYHFRYAHLRPLPVAHALSQAIAANRDDALGALARLDSTGDLASVIAALQESGASRVLAVLAGGPRDAGAQSPDALTLTPAAIRAAILRWGTGTRLRLVLLAAATCRSGSPATILLAAIERRIGQEASNAAPPAPRSTPDRGEPDPPAPGRSARPADPTQETDGTDPADKAPRTAARPAQHAALPMPIETPFAGLFLLWRSVIELGLERLLPEGPDLPRARLTLAATLAGRQWRAALSDPALHWLTGCGTSEALEPDPRLPAAFEAHMAAHATPRAIGTVAQRHAGFRVLLDAASGDWLGLTQGSADPPGSALPVPDPAQRPIARDLDYFGLFGDDPPHLAWVLPARAAFGDLGRRLSGLERSSAAYLAANFIAGTGELDPGELDPGAEAQITLPRVPLDLVLRMTGIDGTVMRLADGRRVRLLLPGGS